MVYWQLIGIRYKNRVLTLVYGEDQTTSKLVLLQRQGIIQFMELPGSVDLNDALNLNSGAAFNTSLTIGSTIESKAAFMCPLIVKRRIFPRNGGDILSSIFNA